jgi:hypothetical protein
MKIHFWILIILIQDRLPSQQSYPNGENQQKTKPGMQNHHTIPEKTFT